MFTLDLQGHRLRASEIALILADPIEYIVGRSAQLRPGGLTYLVGYDPERDNLWDADAALRKLTALWTKKPEAKTLPKVTYLMPWRVSGPETVLAGGAEVAVLETYQYVTTVDGANSTEYAESTAGRTKPLSTQAASNRLSRVADLGLIHPAYREPTPGGGGVRWVYEAVR